MMSTMRVNNGPSTKIGVIWQNSDLWAKNWNFGLKKKKSLLYSNHVMATTGKNCSKKKVAYAQIGAIWEVSPKHPRDPFHDFCLFYYIVFVFLSATFSSLSIQFEIITNISSSQQNGDEGQVLIADASHILWLEHICWSYPSVGCLVWINSIDH